MVSNYVRMRFFAVDTLRRGITSELRCRSQKWATIFPRREMRKPSPNRDLSTTRRWAASCHHSNRCICAETIRYGSFDDVRSRATMHGGHKARPGPLSSGGS